MGRQHGPWSPKGPFLEGHTQHGSPAQVGRKVMFGSPGSGNNPDLEVRGDLLGGACLGEI